MSEFAEGYAVGQGNNNGGACGWGEWIWIIVLFALWGGNGFGGNGMRGDYATQADLAMGFNNSAVLGSINDLKLGQAGIQQTLCQGFSGVDRGLCEISHQISDASCATQRAIDGVNYNMATQACDIKHAINDSTRSILDFLTTDKIATLQAENQNLKLQASQAAQNAYLVNELRPCAKPAYITCSPFQSAYGFYGNNGCGCGCA